MKILEFIKLRLIIRLTLISLLILDSALILFKSNSSDVFFYFSFPLLIYGIYYLIDDLRLIVLHKQIVSIESKSKDLIWVIISTIVLVLIINIIPKNNHDTNSWTLIFIWLMLNAMIKEIRQKIFVCDDFRVEKYGFPWKTKIKLSEIESINSNVNSFTINAYNKDYIVIDLSKSTDNEKAKIESIFNETMNIKHSAKHHV